MSHPDHSKLLKNLNRISGQVEGIKKMIHDQKYCIEITHQIKAARSALLTVENMILKDHIKSCVKEALTNPSEMDAKVEELIQSLNRQER